MNDDVILPGGFPIGSAGQSRGRTDIVAPADVGTLHEENRLIRLELDDLREENRRLRASAQQMRAEIMLLSRALEPMHRMSEALESRSGRGSTAGGGSDEEALQTRVEQLSLQMQAIYASTSWRLTRPVRLLSRLLRGRRGDV